MGLRKAKVAGTSFIEVVLAMGIACMAAAGAAGLLSASDYQAAKARVEEGVGERVRVFTERFASMSYEELRAGALSSGDSPAWRETGFFQESSSSAFPWEMNATAAIERTGTRSEAVGVRFTLQWQEPAPGFPRTEWRSRSLEWGPIRRARF